MKLQEQAKQFREKIYQIQINIENSWTKGWNKRIEKVVEIFDRTHTSDKFKLKAIKMSLENMLK